MDAASDVLSAGGRVMKRLGVLGHDLGEIVEVDLLRVKRARDTNSLAHAELAARDAATTLSGRLRFCGPLTFTRLLVMPRSISMLFSRIATLTSLPRASTWRC